jgi:hypothetical protein
MQDGQLDRPDGSLGLSGRVAILAVVGLVSTVAIVLVGLFGYLPI